MARFGSWAVVTPLSGSTAQVTLTLQILMPGAVMP
jgi:hypothetical protein